MTTLGKLYLLPVPISDASENKFIPAHNFEIIKKLKYFIAEDAKTARRFLKWFGYHPIENAEIALLNEHTKSTEINEIMGELLRGNDVGLMSDAGCPGIADPGADVIKIAHQKGIVVIPLVGPSSIVLSIMASGFNGQNFAFTGYLPIDTALKTKRLKDLEQLALKQNQAQFFIETPYRNLQIFEAALQSLLPQTLLFVGKNLSSATQQISVKTVAAWKKSGPPDIQKIPVVFGIYC